MPLKNDNSHPRGWHSRGYLPHFDGSARAQHVTVHLADSLPKSAIERIDQIIASISDEERAVERRKRLHDWIDAGHGSCLLKNPDLAQIVEGAFHHFDGERYHLFAWVVMPNHFHVLFQPLGDWSMANIVASWKRYTATEIKKWLRARQESGAPGTATLPRGIMPQPRARQESGAPGIATLPRGIMPQSRARQESGAPGIATLPRGSPSAMSFLSGELPIWPREYWDRYIRNEQHFNDVISYIHQNPVKAKLCSLPEKWPYSSAFQA